MCVCVWGGGGVWVGVWGGEGRGEGGRWGVYRLESGGVPGLEKRGIGEGRGGGGMTEGGGGGGGDQPPLLPPDP